MINLLVAGPLDFVERLRRQFEPHQHQARIVSVAGDPGIATELIERSPGAYHAVIFGFSDETNQALLETCVRYGTKFIPFVVCTDLLAGFKKWNSYQAQPVLLDREVATILSFFKDRVIESDDIQTSERLVAQRVDIVEQKTKANTLTVRQKLISIFAPMGGVGKTTLTVSMGKSVVALTNFRVLLVDLDTSRPYGNILKYLGFLGDQKQKINHTVTSWRDFPWEQKAVWEVVENWVFKVSNRLYVLPSIKALSDSSNLSGELITRTLDVLRRHFDLIILDLGNYITDLVVTSMELSDDLFLVTKLDITDIDDMVEFLTDTMPAIKIPSSQVNLVINHVIDGQEFTPKEAAICLNMPCVAAIPEDIEVRKLLANNGQVPYLGAYDTPFTRETEKVLARIYPRGVFAKQNQKVSGIRRFLSRLGLVSSS